jgi:hypothetical protein
MLQFEHASGDDPFWFVQFRQGIGKHVRRGKRSNWNQHRCGVELYWIGRYLGRPNDDIKWRQRKYDNRQRLRGRSERLARRRVLLGPGPQWPLRCVAIARQHGLLHRPNLWLRQRLPRARHDLRKLHNRGWDDDRHDDRRRWRPELLQRQLL